MYKKDSASWSESFDNERTQDPEFHQNDWRLAWASHHRISKSFVSDFQVTHLMKNTGRISLYISSYKNPLITSFKKTIIHPEMPVLMMSFKRHLWFGDAWQIILTPTPNTNRTFIVKDLTIVSSPVISELAKSEETRRKTTQCQVQLAAVGFVLALRTLWNWIDRVGLHWCQGNPAYTDLSS